MKYLSLLLLTALLAACDTSEEDRFFYDGWMKPETASNKRMYGTEAMPSSKTESPSSTTTVPPAPPITGQ